MELKRCDKCGIGGIIDSEIKVDYVCYHYCGKCLREIESYLQELRRKAYKFVAEELSK